jgi:predicted RNase H-like HicB family nuclease
MESSFSSLFQTSLNEAITQGNNRAHALEMAKEALEPALGFYFDDQ